MQSVVNLFELGDAQMVKNAATVFLALPKWVAPFELLVLTTPSVFCKSGMLIFKETWHWSPQSCFLPGLTSPSSPIPTLTGTGHPHTEPERSVIGSVHWQNDSRGAPKAHYFWRHVEIICDLCLDILQVTGVSNFQLVAETISQGSK